jgi:muramidase (phage lysozyme)
MTGNIIGETIDQYVKDQIDLRQKLHYSGIDSFRTPDELNLLNNINSWVKLASSVDVIDDERLKNIKIESINNFTGENLAKQAVLFNSLSSLENDNSYKFREGISNNNSLWNNNTYGLGGNSFGLQPPPGITSINIENVNRGSIRRATIQLKAHNKFQFELIELLYLRLGYSMLLEWGNNKYPVFKNGNIVSEPVRNTLMERGWFDGILLPSEILNKIEEIRKEYNANYDGFFGKVVNFSWSFSQDGTYDITLNLVTVGDVIESLKVNSNLISLSENNTKTLQPPLIRYLTELKSTNSEKETIKTGVITIKIPKNEGNNVFYYIKFDSFLQRYKWTNILIQSNFKNKEEVIYDIDTESQTNMVSYHPQQISFDPSICIFNFEINENDANKDFIKTFKKLDPYIIREENFQAGRLMNLYLNVDYLIDILKKFTEGNNISHYNFFKKLCDDINDALGNVNKIEPILKDDKILTFIDQIPIPNIKQRINKLNDSETYDILYSNDNNAIDLEVYGLNNENTLSNFVRDIKFQTKITPQLSTQVTIGATANNRVVGEEATAFSKWREGLNDRYNKQIEDPNKQLEDLEKNKTKEDFQREWNQPKIAKITSSTKGGKYVRIIQSGPLKGEFLTQDEYVKKMLDIQNPNIITKYENADETIQNILNNDYNSYLIKMFGGNIDTEIVIQKSNRDIANEALDNFKIPFFSVARFITNTFISDKPTNSVTLPSIKPKYFELEQDDINLGKKLYKNYLYKKYQILFDENGNPSNSQGFVPIELDITLDGISGIKIYNRLRINQRFLPSQYPQALNFIITKVEHSIENNDWKTKLRTISVPNVDTIDTKQSIPQSTPAPSPVVETSSNASPIIFNGAGLDPIKNLIGTYESRNNYDIANTGGSAKQSVTKVKNKTLAELKIFSSLPKNNNERVFAAGRYQVIPDTLSIVKTKLKLSDTTIFDESTQEQIGEYLLLFQRSRLGGYLRGVYKGTKDDLIAAVNDIGYEWASMPVIKKSSTKEVVGDIETGTGKVANYGGTGANPAISKVNIATVVNALIKSRIQYSGNIPEYIPSYYQQ